MYMGAITGAAAGLYLGGRGGPSAVRDRGDGRRRLRRRHGLGADPGHPARVLPDERDPHLAAAQLRRRPHPHLPDLRERVVLAPDEGLQRDRLPDRQAAALVGGLAGVDDPPPGRHRCSRSAPCLAVLVAVVLWVLYTRTRFGFEAQVLGDSERAARYAGVRVRRKILAVMALSGAIAGLGGASQVGDFAPLARRRPERPAEARLRLHGDRRRGARPLQPVRGRRRRVPDRRPRERRQHAAGRRASRPASSA